jgi:hypothetical protein
MYTDLKKGTDENNVTYTAVGGFTDNSGLNKKKLLY